MPQIITAATLTASALAHFPSAGVLASVEAGADRKNTLSAVEAAGLQSFAQITGELKWFKAQSTFMVAMKTVTEGTLVQVPEEAAKELLRMERVVEATDAEVAEAQAAAAAEAKAAK